MTRFFFFLTLLIWPFGLLLRFSLPGLSHPIYLLDISVGLLFLSFIFDSKNRKNILKNKFFHSVAIFSLCLTASLLFSLGRLSSSQLLSALFYLARAIVYPAIYFVSLSQNKKEVYLATKVSLIIFTLLALGQYLLLPDLRFLKSLGFDDHYYRLTGTLLDPNFTGAIFAALSIYFLSVSGVWPLVISLTALALTFSRASYLSFFVSLALYSLYTKKIKYLLAVIVLAGLIYFAPKPFGEGVNLLRTFSIFSRLESWQTGLNLFIQKPLFGWGYNTLVDYSGQRISIDNSFIYILATSGIVGFLSFLFLLKNIFQNTNKLGTVIVISFLVHSIFNNSLFLPWVYLAFWLSLSLQLKE